MAREGVADTWERGNPYERYVGRWSRHVAPEFLAWLQVPAGRRWLDVGCGTGALCAAIIEGCAPAAVTGVEPSEGFLATARQQLAGRAELLQGTATDLPIGAQSVDVVVSGLVLNFVADTDAALREMARVLVPGGTVGAYVWDYAGRMELMRYFWDVAVEIDPAAAPLDEGARFPLCRPERLVAALVGADLEDVAVQPIDVETRFESFADYWQPFLGGQGPAPAYVMSLDEPAREHLRQRLAERLPTSRDGSIELVARAWAARGCKPSDQRTA